MCITCGGSIVAIKRTAKRWNPRTVYRCAFHHKRGNSICSNNVEVRQDILDSAILHVISEALNERVLEASVSAALQRIRSDQTKLPDQRVVIERELSLIEARARRLLDIIGEGNGNTFCMKELDGLAEWREILAKNLSKFDGLAKVGFLDPKRLARDLRSRLGDIPALFARHVPHARQMLQTLLEGHITCEPIMDGGKSGYRFTATGTFDRLLTGANVVNDGGGGQELEPQLTSQLRFDIHTVAMVA